ncbi:MAG: hypothetical protein PUP93_32260, partial [Rhizonema sp. NSF051]|nr:hypothetical protein [Rhizonema sp. NSF051]
TTLRLYYLEDTEMRIPDTRSQQKVGIDTEAVNRNEKFLIQINEINSEATVPSNLPLNRFNPLD